jgi:hypothetical protein
MGPLNFPDRMVSSAGPFIFQVKFVENANAAGAIPLDALKDAVGKEKIRFLHRIKLGAWKHPAHYILITNALLSPEFRRWAEHSLTEVLGEINYHFLSGADVCDFLDHEAAIRQSFPQILGLRDLTELIRGAVDKKEIERSRTAIDCATEIAPVFVPTRAYNKAWRVLAEYNFVVLEGPPEMGKSAIAWMIALAQASNGWQAIYCNDPDVFFSQHDSNRHQIFVADDAFGLTEYDPTRSQKWEKELALVTRRLDAKHWLIWTSRKHILERALQKLDFKREWPNFPEPRAVMVSAEDLNSVEKALILYRHAKNAGLSLTLRKSIRNNAGSIVHNSRFTPERIRKLVQEVLPKYRKAEFFSEETVESLNREIREVIANPTERIKTTFRALPASHKWALFAMLEVGMGAHLKKMAESYSRLCPEVDQEPFGDVLDQLTESFIKRHIDSNPFYDGEETHEILTWIHPSYRDLVIDELARDAALSNRFLGLTTLAGIKLAISSAGGQHGDRELPFLTSVQAWSLLADRCHHLTLTVDIRRLPDFMEVLSSATREARGLDEKRYLQGMLKDTCDVTRQRWDETERILTPEELDAYLQASLLVSPLPPIPILQVSWDTATTKFMEEIQWSKDNGYFFPDAVTSFVKLVKIIGEIEPRFLRQNEFNAKFPIHFEQVVELTRSELANELYGDEPDDIRSDSYRFKALRDLVAEVAEILPEFKEHADSLAPKLILKIEEIDRKCDEEEEPEREYGEETMPPSEGQIDIDLLFADL